SLRLAPQAVHVSDNPDDADDDGQPQHPARREPLSAAQALPFLVQPQRHEGREHETQCQPRRRAGELEGHPDVGYHGRAEVDEGQQHHRQGEHPLPAVGRELTEDQRVHRLPQREVDHREDEDQVDDVPDPHNVVEHRAELDPKVLVEVGEDIGLGVVAEQEVPGDGGQGVHDYAEHGGDPADIVHVLRRLLLELVVDGLHIEMADVGVGHDGYHHQQVQNCRLRAEIRPHPRRGELALN
uniref:Uncharacterized protein n=1 Tax=Triticum urartu TaxID=4572 RepID=A0A8R7REX6_TRIUA